MSEEIRIREEKRVRFVLPFLLVIVFAAISAWLYTIHLYAGIGATVLTVLYVIVIFVLRQKYRPTEYDELVDFATQYGSVQKQILDEFEVPLAVTDEHGKILWVNQLFAALTGKGKDYRKSITSVFSAITSERLSKNEELNLPIDYEDRHLRAHIRRIYLQIEQENESESDFPEKKEEFLILMHFFDETKQTDLEREAQNTQMIPALVYIDNYEEISDAVEDVKQSLLLALVDRKVNRYFSASDGLVKKIEKDKYFVVFKRKYLKTMIENKFSLLEDIKTIRLGNESSMTLSIGIGCSENGYIKSHDYARTAIELALGRGGDQAVLKTQEEIQYFGGKSETRAKSTRVKARVKALALREIMVARDNFYIMGHSIADVDSFGAAVGIYCAARQLGKHAQIVLDDVNTSLRPFRDCFAPEKGYPTDMIISSKDALERAHADAALIVVDTNRPSYTECPQLLNRIKTVIVFDHHRVGSETIRNAVLSYIEPYASSTCEMIAEVLQYFDEDIRLSDEEADALYAGMLIDTNNFVTKTGVRTFEAAAYLRRSGAEVTRVRKLLRNDMEAYKARAEAIRAAEVYRNCFAISVCPADRIESPTVASAQAANELLNIVGIKASFVLTDYHGKIFISSRSIDEINVQRIMERLGGGGHMSTAGAQLANCSVSEAVRIIKNTLDEMIREGDIKE